VALPFFTKGKNMNKTIAQIADDEAKDFYSHPPSGRNKANLARHIEHAVTVAHEPLITALKSCANQFSDYEKMHMDKTPPDLVKAERNRLMAEMCRKVIS
jgi:hypothetical protein